MSELFDAVDALIASRSTLPPPAERRRLRQAHALTLDEVAAALDVRRATIGGWESGKAEPRPPQREAYARLLAQLALLYPAMETAAPAAPQPEAPAPAPEASGVAGPRPADAKATATPAPSTESGATARAPHPTPAAAPSRPSSRRPGAPKAAVRTHDAGPAHGHGPLLVLDADADGQVTGYGVGGLLLDVPAKSLPALVEWALSDAQLGAERLHGSGKDADPLLVLTPAACERYGLPGQLPDSARLAGRLPEGHKVLGQLERAEWQLTKRGFGPWARIYRPVQGAAAVACSCASPPGTPWTTVPGDMPHSWLRRNSPGCWACTRSGS